MQMSTSYRGNNFFHELDPEVKYALTVNDFEKKFKAQLRGNHT